jgi:hypothetical protein
LFSSQLLWGHPASYPVGADVSVCFFVFEQTASETAYLPFSAEVKEAWSYTSIPPYVFSGVLTAERQVRFNATWVRFVVNKVAWEQVFLQLRFSLLIICYSPVTLP